MPKTITVTETIRSFSDIVGQVYYKGESFNIRKGANIVAKLVPAKSRPTIAVKDLNGFFMQAPHLEEGDDEGFINDIQGLKALKDNGGYDKWD